MKFEVMLRLRLITDLNSMLTNLFAVNSALTAVLNLMLMTDLMSVAGLTSVTDSDSADLNSASLLSAFQVSVSLILMMKTERTAVVMTSDDFTKADEDMKSKVNMKGL